MTRNTLIGISLILFLTLATSCKKKDRNDDINNVINWDTVEVSKVYVDPFVEEHWDTSEEMPSCHMSVKLLYPSITGSNHTEVRDSLVKNITQWFFQVPLSDYSKEGVRSQLEGYVERQLEDYKLDIDQAKTLNFDLPAYSVFNREFESRDSLTYSENGLISVISLSREYSGGAHGNEVLTTFNYDLSNLVRITPSTLFKNPKDDGLILLLLNQLIDFFGVTSADELEYQGVFNYRMLEVTNNFYFTRDGVSFYYNPYELAIYAVGPIELNLTFESLAPYLSSEYKYLAE